MNKSFFQLYNSIESSLNDDLFKSRQSSVYLFVQISPNEPYSFTTNYPGGISFQSDQEVYIVDNCDNNLQDITNKVYIEEFIDEDGNNQCKVEILPLRKDFYGRAIFIKFYHPLSNESFYTRPLMVTDKRKERTYRFDYSNDGTFYNSVSLAVKFSSPNNQSEVGDYFQISSGNTISTRPLRKMAFDYNIEQIDTTSFFALQELLFSNIIYLDGVRITNKPTLEQGDRIGETNLIKASFSGFLDYNDTKEYEYQIYEGFNIIDFIPTGSYSFSNIPEILVYFNQNIQINTGNLTIYDQSDNSVLATYDETHFSIDNPNAFIGGLPPDFDFYIGDFYILFDAGLISSVDSGEVYQGVTDPTFWTFSIVNGDYSIDDYSASDYLTD